MEINQIKKLFVYMKDELEYYKVKLDNDYISTPHNTIHISRVESIKTVSYISANKVKSTALHINVSNDTFIVFTPSLFDERIIENTTYFKGE